MGHGRAVRAGVGVVLALLVAVVGCSDDDDDAGGGDAVAEAAGEAGAECTPARDAEAGTERRTIEVDGAEREADVSVPEGYDGTTAAPLIVDLHGFTSTIEDQTLLSNLPDAGGERGYVVVTPQALETDLPVGDGGAFTFWNVTVVTDGGAAEVEGGLDAADDLGFIDALLAELEDELCIDADRVYATGMSNGAGMAMALACTDPARWAAVAPVAAVNMTTSCPADGPVSTVAFHGDADPLVDYDGGTVAGFELGNPSVLDRMAELAALGGCAAEPTSEVIEDVARDEWEGCDEGVDVVLFTVLGGGHTWPGVTTYRSEEELAPDPDAASPLGEVDPAAVAGEQTTNIVATEIILDFFDAHRRVG